MPKLKYTEKTYSFGDEDSPKEVMLSIVDGKITSIALYDGTHLDALLDQDESQQLIQILKDESI